MSGPSVVSGFAAADPATLLTPCQYEVVRRLALGQTWDTIGKDLGISRRTIADHRVAALDRLGVPTMHDVWMKLGWLVVPDAA